MSAENVKSVIVHNCFYNAVFNLGTPDGRLKYIWGVMDIDLVKDIQAQILAKNKYDGHEVFNFNLTALNEVAVVQNVALVMAEQLETR
jgi:hypothetical protein